MKAPVAISQNQNLNERRAALEAKLKELLGSLQDRSELNVENSADVLDTIRMATDRDVLVERMNMSARVLNDIRGALARLDNGEYGICEDCEEPISPLRLKAIPWAVACVKCQEARDRRHKEADDDGFSVAA